MPRKSFNLVAAAAFILTSILAAASPAQNYHLTTCPLLGAPYPKPTAINSTPIFQQTVQDLETTLHSQLKVLPYNETSFSVGIFSSDPNDDDEVLDWQYHSTSALLSDSSQGTRSVDADSVYRIASISKLLTVYVFLLSQGDGLWGKPVAKYLPELVDLTGDSTHVVPNWMEITLGDLAGQTAGLGRDYGLADLTIQNNDFGPLTNIFSSLLPDDLADPDVPDCGYIAKNKTFVPCEEQEYLRGIANAAPIFPAGSRTVYSNQAYALLGLIVSRITGKPFERLFIDHLVDTLGLKGTSYRQPATIDEQSVIPGNARLAEWTVDTAVFTPAGGNFASTADLAKIGRAILNSVNLSPATTQRWLKPTSFVNSMSQGVGRPWEINRLQALNRSVDLYTKAGDWGVYHSIFVLVPDYGVGFTVLTAVDPESPAGADARGELPNMIARPLIEAVDAVAKEQAAVNFAGTYTDQGANSTLTFEMDDGSALRLTAWIQEGKDILATATEVLGELDWRLLPNELYDSNGSNVGFTSFYQTPAPERLFFGACDSWASVDGLNFGNVPVGQFVFDVNEETGKANGVESLAFRAKVARQE